MFAEIPQLKIKLYAGPKLFTIHQSAAVRCPVTLRHLLNFINHRRKMCLQFNSELQFGGVRSHGRKSGKRNKSVAGSCNQEIKWSLGDQLFNTQYDKFTELF
jgi:hypothetical protein